MIKKFEKSLFFDRPLPLLRYRPSVAKIPDSTVSCISLMTYHCNFLKSNFSRYALFVFQCMLIWVHFRLTLRPSTLIFLAVQISGSGISKSPKCHAMEGGGKFLRVSILVMFFVCTRDLIFRAPDGCLQYHTGVSGRITSFNFLDSGGTHLASQKYELGKF